LIPPIVRALGTGRYLGVLDTVFSATGDLTAISGKPLLLGGADSSNPVASDNATDALLLALRGPVDALAAEVVGACNHRVPLSARVLSAAIQVPRAGTRLAAAL
jgi:2',3'-cyclic-nucleotide 2'-phosphodiesterase (5'-nucleotidase family)